jgi:hypothetical protein
MDKRVTIVWLVAARGGGRDVYGVYIPPSHSMIRLKSSSVWVNGILGIILLGGYSNHHNH